MTVVTAVVSDVQVVKLENKQRKTEYIYTNREVTCAFWSF